MTTTAETLRKRRELIQQLLAKAANNPSVHEAEACQEHAERLMVRYGIERAELEDADVKAGAKPEPIIQKPFVVKHGLYKVVERMGVCYVINALDGLELVYYGRANTDVTMYVIGAEGDVDQALRLLSSLAEQAQHAMAAWWRSARHEYDTETYTNSERRNERKGFIRGFYLTVSTRLADLREAAHAESSGTALVVQGRNERVKDAVEELNGKVRAARRRQQSPASVRALAAGRAAGEAADLSGGHIAAAERRTISAA